MHKDGIEYFLYREEPIGLIEIIDGLDENAFIKVDTSNAALYFDPVTITGNCQCECSRNGIVAEEMNQIKMLIAHTVAQRSGFKDEMQEWYDRFPTGRFAKLDNVITIDRMLSELDSNYKRLSDFHNQAIRTA